MSDDTKKTTDKSGEKTKDRKSGKWSTGVKVGAAVGSAAVAAALIYAGRHQVKKHDDFGVAKRKPRLRYENEPILDEEDDDLTSEYDGYAGDEEE